MIADFPDRRFQLWEYRVSHGSLLIPSPKNPEAARNTMRDHLMLAQKAQEEEEEIE